ncbi:alpha-glucuronidase [Mucilaginibacter roseus]|uniref:Xylan alpha-1,2-glucuronidase n=1 Tax=Mucilaginibacter roseus TaxID=1528868 RepID=A0ABS8U154_9SPHI|nr:alpha-glucuronidase family glycosyl hydrolase [Mucilaginibacter roseus]MCD8739276.1 alpha-glucuronidase [Mucilaginibacter roseus]
MKFIYTFLLCSLLVSTAKADNGYRLWLRYDHIDNATLARQYRQQLASVTYETGNSPIIQAAQKELRNALQGLLNYNPAFVNAPGKGSTLIFVKNGSKQLSPALNKLINNTGNEGYVIKTISLNNAPCLVVGAANDKGILYGTFHLLRLLQTHQSLTNINIVESPKTQVRILNHWDNLDRTVERGYAGFSIWNWHKLPGYIDPRYIDYARANASIGVNGAVINNVNANSLILTADYLRKTAALAGVFRRYGIKLYLSAKFSAPIEIGGLKTADPLDPAVKQWWQQKADEIYRYIPDFGGFLVKANSEGQPGPQNYGRTHADGANMLADVLKPHGGIVMWRAFVYDDKTPDDRAKQAYNEFKPLDGKFRSNVIIQVKNGAIDFQPREPFHPLFGAMKKTQIMPEFQITQEYLGFSTHLVYLATLFKECFDANTYSEGRGSTVAKIISSPVNNSLTGIAGVANIGTDINWCGHPFAQANWYAFGRLAWNPDQSAAAIAQDWLKMTFSNQADFVKPITSMMLSSRETTVNYMTPLGLHHIMGTHAHYGPAPWVNNLSRADWNPVYYHKADSAGIGFDRTATGSNAVAQYYPPLRDSLNKVETTPEKYLLWFHHVGWNSRLKNGETLWNELVKHYYKGAADVAGMQKTWASVKGKVDSTRYHEVEQLLAIQAGEAAWWRNACVLYFQTFSKLPLPAGYTKPDHDLQYYKDLKFHYLP